MHDRRRHQRKCCDSNLKSGAISLPSLEDTDPRRSTHIHDTGAYLGRSEIHESRLDRTCGVVARPAAASLVRDRAGTAPQLIRDEELA